MASHVTTALTWSGSNNFVCTTNNQVVASDAFYFDVNDYQVSLSVYVNYASSATAADSPPTYVAMIPGDILGVGSNSADTQEWAQYYRDMWYTQPDITTMPLSMMALGFILYVVPPRAGANNVTIRAMVNAHRAV